MMSWSIVNGELKEETHAVLPATDLAISRGYGVFDFFRTSKGVALFRADHLQRLYSSANHLRLRLPYTIEELEMQSEQLIQKNGYGSSGMRIVVTGGVSEDSYTIGRPSVILTERELTIEDEMQTGFQLITHSFRRELPEVKSINYLTGIYLQDKIRQAGANDVLYVYENRILELPRANIFLVTKDNRLVTPEKEVLHGITRNKVLKLAQDEMVVECRTITLGELKDASEVFITSTTKRIIPVFSVDGKIIGAKGVYPVAKKLFRQLLDLETKIINGSIGSN